ncbi:PKD domain-containing protein, partial [Crocinitomix sp.]|nr:PKD domain-containing protein [Crocinitomix sp.]
MKNILSLKRAALLMFALSFYTIGNTQICIPLPAMDGTPSPSMAPAGWTIWIPSPDLISGLGPWPGGGGYVTYDVDGFSEAGGEMSMMLATAGGFVTEGIQTTLTGLTAGLTYEVSLEWQQATLSNVSNVYAEGRLSVTVEGTETIFTSVGGLDDGWQVATVTFVASGPTSNFQCKGIPTEIPNGLVGYAIVVDDYPCITGLEISVPSVDICVGECADLEAITSGEIGDVTYEWSPGIPDIDANVTVCPDETTIYQVIGTDEDGQVDTTLVTVTVHDIPDVDLGPDAFLASCIADEIILDAENEGSTYEWQDGSTDQMLLITEPGLYWVEVTNEFGCQSSDTIEIELADSPDLSAKIEFIINGFSSEDGATGGCILNPVEFNDISFVGDPGVIVEWDWNFGDGGSSTEENPEHSYGTEGTYTITLTVTTDEGCTDTYSIDIIMTSSLSLEFLINEPTCYGFSDGSITVNVAGGGDELTFIITDSDGNEMNEGNSNTANTLNKGWYYFDVSDESSCDAIDSVFLDEPGELDIDITVTDPLCFGFKTGWARVDSVYNTTGDYDGVSYIWNPNPAGVGGEGADSTYNMGAGDYTLTINDDNGCSKVFD